MDLDPNIDIADLESRADHVAERLSLLANAKRLLILCELSKGEASVGALQASVGISQSALSQHLAKLREAGMVATRREGQTIHYSISDRDIEVLMGGTITQTVPGNLIGMAIAGLVVGLGTGIGSGCTSGHGVCGLARLSKRSLAAVLTFMSTGVATVFVLRHVIGA